VVEKCIVEHFMSNMYEEMIQKYKNLDSLEKKKRALEEISKDAYEKFIKNKGEIDKKEFLIGFHRFYNKIEREIKEEESEQKDRLYFMDRLQKLDYEMYREKKEYLEPMKKYMSLLTVFNVIIFCLLGFFIYDKFANRESKSNITKETVVIKEKSIEKNKENSENLLENQEFKNSEDFFEIGREAHSKKDYEEAYKNYLKAIELGHARAEYIVGIFYFRGYYVKQDYNKALEYWNKASKQGMREADYSLAMAYIKSFGVEKDLEIAKIYLEKAIIGEVKEAYYTLGNLYYLEKNYQEAIKIWEKGYEKGDISSGRSLVNLYLYGDKTIRNIERGKEIHREIN